MDKKYVEYLKSNEWLIIRQLKIKQADKKCEYCGSRRRLRIHHLTYKHIYNEFYHLEDLIVVCDACHKAIHHIKPVTNVKKKTSKKQQSKKAKNDKIVRCKRKTLARQAKLKRKQDKLKQITNKPVKPTVRLGITTLK